MIGDENGFEVTEGVGTAEAQDGPGRPVASRRPCEDRRVEREGIFHRRFNCSGKLWKVKEMLGYDVGIVFIGFGESKSVLGESGFFFCPESDIARL